MHPQGYIIMSKRCEPTFAPLCRSTSREIKVLKAVKISCGQHGCNFQTDTAKGGTLKPQEACGAANSLGNLLHIFGQSVWARPRDGERATSEV